MIRVGGQVVADGAPREVLAVGEGWVLVRLDGEATGRYPLDQVTPLEGEEE